MTECDKFPGEWEKDTPSSGGTYRVCRCDKCLALWPCPGDLLPGHWIEVANSHGVFFATVVRCYFDEAYGGTQVDIESDDPGAPDYLQHKVHKKWSIGPRNSLWRVFHASRWINFLGAVLYPHVERAEVPSRFEREVL